jgi:hypothetical protein
VRRTLLLSFVILALCVCPRAHADVGVVLNDSLDTSVARITGSGHTAVYLSRICPETPVKMRLCGPHEDGSVVSNYTSLGEDTPFEWNIVSLNTYLYGTLPQEAPLFSSGKIKNVLEERYRKQVLQDYCVTHSCRTSDKAEWREMVSATSERTLYILAVSTTVAQDEALIEKFNSSTNVNHFNGMTRNCADFTRDVVNTYFPHATHRNFLNDFGMTSPKGIARSFAHYANKHPDSDYYVLHFAQLPGTIKRSSPCREGTEQLYRSKKLLVPMAVFASHELPFALGSYLVDGRFNPQHEFELHATVRETQLRVETKVASEDDDTSRAHELSAAANDVRGDIVGTAPEWAAYREKFGSIVNDAVAEGVIPNREALGHTFKTLDEQGRPYLDDQGRLWLEIRDGEESVRVGLTEHTLLAPGSNRGLAYKIMLARVDYILKSSPRSRESMANFEGTWDLLQRARTQIYVAAD